MAGAPGVAEGTLLGGLPYLALGAGPPLVLLRGFTTSHSNPTGLQRSFELRLVRPYAEHYTVYSVNRPPGLAADVTMADIATMHAAALTDRFDGPVPVIGVSSGGSVALKLAIDHPSVVSRLVLIASGCRVGDEARAAQLRYVEAAEQGRRGAHHLVSLKVTSPVAARVVGWLTWLVDPLIRPKDTTDMARFSRAEDAFDACGRLSAVTAPTLVIGGDADRAYPTEILRRTADGVRDGRLILYPGRSHGSTMTHRSLADDVTSFLRDGG